VPGLESRNVVVDADADLAICGAVSDLGGPGGAAGGGVDIAASPSRSSRASSEDVGAGARPTDEAVESARRLGRAGGGLAVRREVRLSGDDDPGST